VGRTKLTTGQIFDEHESVQSESIDKICKAAGFMQEKKIGALIVFERETQLGEIINTGTIVDATTSVSVVNNIFFP
jgi:diadenylate cyclase